MTFRRVINLLILLSFLPIAAGCSSQKLIQIDSVPDPEADPLRPGRSIRISGYTSHDGSFQEWMGTVHSTSEDSLMFTRNEHTQYIAERDTLQVLRGDVSSVSVTDMHWGRTIVLGGGLFVVTWAALLACCSEWE